MTYKYGYRVNKRRAGGGGAPSYNASTVAFMAAINSADPTLFAAMDKFILNWKGEGVINSEYNFWAHTRRLHVYVGADRAKFRIDVKTATPNITLVNVVDNTGCSTAGFTPNNVDQYIDTGVEASEFGDYVASGYCKIWAFNTNTNASANEGFILGGQDLFYVATKVTDDNMYYRNNNNVEAGISQAGISTRNIYQVKGKAGSGSIRRAKTLMINQAPDLLPVETGHEFLAAVNVYGSASNFDERTRNFDALLFGLEVDTTMSNIMVDIINELQTDLGRNNYE